MNNFLHKYPLLSAGIAILGLILITPEAIAASYTLQPFGPTGFTELINEIARWVFTIAIPIAVIMIIYAGLMMLTAGSKPANYEKGKQILKYAITGLVIIFIGRGFISLIKSILELGQ